MHTQLTESPVDGGSGSWFIFLHKRYLHGVTASGWNLNLKLVLKNFSSSQSGAVSSWYNLSRERERSQVRGITLELIDWTGIYWFQGYVKVMTRNVWCIRLRSKKKDVMWNTGLYKMTSSAIGSSSWSSLVTPRLSRCWSSNLSYSLPISLHKSRSSLHPSHTMPVHPHRTTTYSSVVWLFNVMIKLIYQKVLGWMI